MNIGLLLFVIVVFGELMKENFKVGTVVFKRGTCTCFVVKNFIVGTCTCLTFVTGNLVANTNRGVSVVESGPDDLSKSC